MRLIKKPKQRYASWTEELNLDNLASLGPQWWVVRVSRVTGHEIAERIARSMPRNFPDMEFKRKINKPRPVDEMTWKQYLSKQKKSRSKLIELLMKSNKRKKASPNLTRINASRKPADRGGKAGKTTTLKLGSSVQVTLGFLAPLRSSIAKQGWQLLDLRYLDYYRDELTQTVVLDGKKY